MNNTLNCGSFTVTILLPNDSYFLIDMSADALWNCNVSDMSFYWFKDLLSFCSWGKKGRWYCTNVPVCVDTWALSFYLLQCSFIAVDICALWLSPVYIYVLVKRYLSVTNMIISSHSFCLSFASNATLSKKSVLDHGISTRSLN